MRLAEMEVEEGYDQDRKITFRTRNAEIIAKRNKHDNYTLQVCSFVLNVHGVFVIDCHQKRPLHEGERITNLDNLVCLCLTCHRIAHSKIPPLTLDEIKASLKAAGLYSIVPKHEISVGA
jgi:predicted HNH restriction endonuclease